VTFPSSIGEPRHRHPSVSAPSSAKFAHPSEGLFASLLTLYGLEWSYEPVEFPLEWNELGQPTKGFRPDFYIPSQQLFIELTVLEQRLVTRKNKKVRLFRTLYPEIALLVVYQRDFTQLLERHDLEFFAHPAA
jgi:hypoxanthine phosphoribosyltransferase